MLFIFAVSKSATRTVARVGFLPAGATFTTDELICGFMCSLFLGLTLREEVVRDVVVTRVGLVCAGCVFVVVRGETLCCFVFEREVTFCWFCAVFLDVFWDWFAFD